MRLRLARFLANKQKNPRKFSIVSTQVLLFDPMTYRLIFFVDPIHRYLIPLLDCQPDLRTTSTVQKPEAKRQNKFN